MTILLILIVGLLLFVSFNLRFDHPSHFPQEYRYYAPPQQSFSAPPQRSILGELLITALFLMLCWLVLSQPKVQQPPTAVETHRASVDSTGIEP